MLNNIGFLLTRYGIISSIRKVILILGIILTKFLFIPLFEILIRKSSIDKYFIKDFDYNSVGDDGESKQLFSFGSDMELGIVLIVFYILHRNLFGVPFTFKIYSLRTLLILMESHYFLLSQTRALDKLGLKCQHRRCDDLSPIQHSNNLEKIEKELKIMEQMKSKYDTPKSKHYIGYLTLNSYLKQLKEAYSLMLYPCPQYFIYPILYPVNQFIGCQMALIETLVKQQINNKDDAMDFCERIEYSTEYIDGLLLDLKVRQKKEIIPPKWIIEVCIKQIDSKILSAATSRSSISDYFLYKKLSDDLNKLVELKKINHSQVKTILKELERVIDTYLIPSFTKLNQYLIELKEQSKEGDGVWRADNGDQLYEFLLRYHSGTNLTAKEIHSIGLKQVALVKKEIVKLFKDEYPEIEKKFGDTLRLLSKKQDLQFSEGDKGRKEIIECYENIIKDVSGKLDAHFERMPLATCSVERVPLFKEAESAPAYYTPPPMDKSKGGVFNVNLRNTDAHTKAMAKNLCYHEATPGHHFQLSLAQEFKDVDAFRRLIVFTSYAEGWALYVEKLADELGWYETKYERLAYLVAEMWRSTRLVIDTGLHSSEFKWTREQSIQYMKDNTYLEDSDITSEVDRYIVIPGQAVAYKIGQLKISELRELAKSKLGSKFQLKKFHSAILNNGSLPLNILEVSVNNWIEKELKL